MGIEEDKKISESHLRSLLKGISWRLVGTIDTMMVSYFFTGNLKISGKIGATEIITKIILYYFHERIWIYFLKNRDEHIFSFAKAVTWRIIGTLDTMLLAWFYTGSPMTGLKIGFGEIFTKILLFYFHERLWHRLPLGTIRRLFKLK